MTQCPVLTPQQRQSVELMQRAEQAMMKRIMQAIKDAAIEVEAGFKSIPFDEPTPHRDYFAAVAHRQLFLTLCGADPETGQGGNAVLAAAILESDRNFVASQWQDRSHDEILASAAQTDMVPNSKD